MSEARPMSGRMERDGRHDNESGERPGRGRERRPYTFVLDRELVEAARREVGESDMVRSIEAALAAAIDYQLWIREVAAGERDLLG
ncbi:MAG: hypothetical protein ACODAE_11250 [Gemmatimonadota bacterium]